MNSRIFKTSSIIFLIVLSQTACSLSLFSEGKNQDRSYIYGVGSSTISPLMASVSEEFSRTQAIKGLIIETPVVESTGTIEGIKVFCSGLNKKFPDFVSASRPIHNDEIRICNQNGVKEIVEIKIGYDGIVLANSNQNEQINLTKEQIFLALAKRVVDEKTGKIIKNPYKKWSEIDSKLPNKEIIVYGPPLSSGTRDVFVDIMMNGACFSDKKLIAAYPDEISRKEQCSSIREDGHFVESGENDALIAKSLKNNSDAFGIVGFNFLVTNDLMKSTSIDGVKANFENITSKKYSLSRPLYVYFKRENLRIIPRMGEFINELISSETLGRKGYLTHSGLVPLSDKEIDLLQKNIRPLID